MINGVHSVSVRALSDENVSPKVTTPTAPMAPRPRPMALEAAFHTPRSRSSAMRRVTASAGSAGPEHEGEDGSGVGAGEHEGGHGQGPAAVGFVVDEQDGTPGHGPIGGELVGID